VRERRFLSVSLPLIVTNPDTRPRARARPQRWALDTRFTDEAFAWRHHLIEAGLDPDGLRSGFTYLTPLGSAPRCPVVSQQLTNSPKHSLPNRSFSGDRLPEPAVRSQPGKQLSLAGNAGAGGVWFEVPD